MFFWTIFCLFFGFFYIFEIVFTFFFHCVIFSLTISSLFQVYKRLFLFMSVSICGSLHPLVIHFSKTANSSKFKWIFFHKLNTHLQHKFGYFFPFTPTTCVATLVDQLTISIIPTFLTIPTIPSFLTIPNVPTKFEVGTVGRVGLLGSRELKIFINFLILKIRENHEFNIVSWSYD